MSVAFSLFDAGNWSADGKYGIGAIVFDDGRKWVCVFPCMGIRPPDEKHWLELIDDVAG